MRFQDQNTATSLTPIPTPSHPWQIYASDIFTLDGMDYLILADFYSKVILVCNLPTGQSNSATSWKNSLVIMAHQKSYAQIMANSMLVLPLQIAALNGVSPMKPPVSLPTVQWICEVMCQDSQAYTPACHIQW